MRLQIAAVVLALLFGRAEAQVYNPPILPGIMGAIYAGNYGVSCDGSADNTTALQNAINATALLGSTPNGGTLYLPPGICKITGAVTITSGMRLVGAGKNGATNTGGTTIRTSSTTADVFTVTTQDPVMFENFTIDTLASKVSGAGISIDGSDATHANVGSIISHMKIKSMYDNIVTKNAFAYRIHDNLTSDAVHNGLLTQPTSDFPDGTGGGSQVHDNAFFNVNTHATCHAGVEYQGSGHYDIHDNVFDGCDYGVLLNAKVGPTGTLKIIGNSIEDQNKAQIALTQGTSGIDFTNVIISNNEMSNISGAATVLSEGSIHIATGTAGTAPKWIKQITITGNVMNHGSLTVAAGAFIQIDDGNTVAVSNNTLNAGGSSGVAMFGVGSAAQNVTLDSNNTAYNLSGATKYGTVTWANVNQQTVRQVAAPTMAQNSTFYITPGYVANTGIGPIAIETAGGVLRNLIVGVGSAPAAGQTYTITVYTATQYTGVGSASSITCTISNPDRTCTDTTHSATLGANAGWAIQVVTSATSGSTGLMVGSLGLDK